MKKVVSILVCIFILALFIAGCGSAKTDATKAEASAQPAASTAAEPKKQEVPKKKAMVDIWELEDNDTYMGKIVADFNSSQQDITVNETKYPLNGYLEALKTAAGSNTLPDIWYIWGGSVGSFYAENGCAMDLTEYAKQHNWDKKFNPAGINLSSYGGKLYGVPFHISGMSTFYNKSVFQKLNLQVPKSLDEFEACMQKMKDNGITPLAIGGKYSYMTMRFTEALLETFAGPELHDKLNNLQATWNCLEVVKTYAKLQEWVKKGYFAKGFVTLDAGELRPAFYKGQVGFTMEGQWIDDQAVKDGQDVNAYGFFPFPTGHTPLRISSFGNSYQVNAKSPKDKQDASLIFAEYFTDLKTLDKYADVVTPLAVNGIKLPASKPHIKEVADALAAGNWLVSDQIMSQELKAKFNEAQDKVCLLEMTPEKAAEFMQKSIEELKAK